MSELSPERASLLPANLLGDPQRLVVARDRGTLLAQQVPIDSNIPSASIFGYEDCVLTHEDLMARRDRAEDGLRMATGHPVIPKEGLLTSWHLRTEVLPGDEAKPGTEPTETALAAEVKIAIRGGKIETGYSLRDSIEVRTHVVQPLTDGPAPTSVEYFTNDLLGLVIFRGDAELVGIPGEDVTPRPFTTIAAEIRRNLALAARRKAVAPLVGGLMATPTLGKKFSSYPYALGAPDVSLIMLLHDNPPSEAAALNMLELAFQPEKAESFLRLLQFDLDSLTKGLTQYGATERFSWLAKVLTDTRECVRRETLMATTIDFKAAFEEALKVEVVKVARLEELTSKLAQLTLISAQAPVKKKPVELTSHTVELPVQA